MSDTIALPASPTPTCLVCDGPTHGGFAVCFCCCTLVRQLGMPLVPLVTVTGYQLGDVMHRRLRGYKDSPVAEARDHHLALLGTLVETWMGANRARLGQRFRAPWDLVVTVPSSSRPSGSPADALVSRVPELARLRRAVLVRGPQVTGHLTATRHGFVTGPGVDRTWLTGRRVLVFDDSVVTGARAQSAAAALRLAGAEVVGGLAVGGCYPVAGWRRAGIRLDLGHAPPHLHRAPTGGLLRPAVGGSAGRRVTRLRRLLPQ